MGVNLSIKNVPEALAERLRRRASANHRSLQKELMIIVEAAAAPEIVGDTGPSVVSGTDAAPRRLSAQQAEPGYDVVQAEPGYDALPEGALDDLLAEFDAIVAGSRWGEAPLLTREQAHDRRLSREIDFDARALHRSVARAPRLRGPLK